MRVFYPVSQVTELAAGYRYTTADGGGPGVWQGEDYDALTTMALSLRLSPAHVLWDVLES